MLIVYAFSVFFSNFDLYQVPNDSNRPTCAVNTLRACLQGGWSI